MKPSTERTSPGIDEILDGATKSSLWRLDCEGRRKGSSEEVELSETHVWKLRDGKAIEIREYRIGTEGL